MPKVVLSERRANQFLNHWAAAFRRSEGPVKDTSVCEQQLLLREPWPCDPAAEAAIQPQIGCFQSWFFQPFLLSGGMFFSQTPAGEPPTMIVADFHFNGVPGVRPFS